MTRAEFHTARLHLRPVALTDQDAVLAGLNDLSVSGWLAVVPYPYGLSDFLQFQSEIAKPGTTFAIVDDTGFAGILGLENAKLGYWLLPRAMGQGYATEAGQGALGWHFAQGGGPVGAGYFDGNAPSAHVLHKLGFAQTGRGDLFCRALNTVRPHVDLSLTAQAYHAALPWDAQSPRLTFRALQATDAQALHGIVAHFEVTRQLGPKWPWPAHLDFTMTRAQPFHGQGFAWGMFRDGALIGTISVADGQLGYMLTPDAWGQGYASEACHAALTHAFASGLTHVMAGVWADNLASQRVLTKLGFKVTGHSHDISPARGLAMPGLELRLDWADWR